MWEKCIKTPRRYPLSSFTAIFLAAVAALWLNLPRTGQLERTYPVQGTVFLGDKPVAKAQVIFTPVEKPALGTIVSTGTTAQDGSFALSTFNHEDGVPAGEYFVMIYRGDSVIPGLDSGEEGRGFRVHVKAGENKLEPFRFKRLQKAAGKKKQSKQPSPELP